MFKIFPLLLISFFLLDENPDPKRFENQIVRYDSLNQSNPISPDSYIFYGSSSIFMWKSLANDFTGYPVINRGFGGSHMSDAIYYFDRVLLPLHPRKVILYEGDNDIAAGKAPQQILKDFKTLYKLFKQKLPETEIGVLAAKPSPSRWKFKSEYEATNELLKKYCASKNALYFIDVYSPMLNEVGYPNASYYIGDSLHMNDQGYALWTEIVRPFIEK